MRNVLFFGVTATFAVAAIATVPSCKTASAIRAHYTTDFGCRADGALDRKVMFALVPSGGDLVFDGRDPADAERCVPAPRATIGDQHGLLLRPSTTSPTPYEQTYDLVAIVGTTGDTASACNVGADGHAKGVLGGASCVVAKRKLRFVNGSEVEQKIFLSSACAGVMCDRGSSCNPATRLCTVQTENSDDPSGGDPKEPEADGGAPPLVDATVPDSEPPPPPPVPACTVPTGTCQGGPVVVGAFFGVAPKVAAHEGKIAFVRDIGGTSQIGTYDFAAAGTATVAYLPNPIDGPPKAVAYGLVGNAKKSSLIGAIEGGSITGDGYVLEAYDETVRDLWSPVSGSGGNSGFPFFVSDGAFYGGLVQGPIPARETSPFARNASGEFVKHAPNVDTQITPFVGPNQSGAPRLVWGSSKGVQSIGQGDALPATHANAPPSAPARLVAFGPTDRVVAIDSAGNLLLLGDVAGAPARTILTNVSRDAVAADTRRIYVLVGAAGAKARLYAIDKSTLRATVPSMCELPTPSGGVAGLTVDATCLYVTTTSQVSSGGGSQFSVTRTALVP